MKRTCGYASTDYTRLVPGSFYDQKAEGRGTQKPDPLPFSPLQREPLRHVRKYSRFGARWHGAEPGSRGYRHVSTSKSCLFQSDCVFSNWFAFAFVNPDHANGHHFKFATIGFKQPVFHLQG